LKLTSCRNSSQSAGSEGIVATDSSSISDYRRPMKRPSEGCWRGGAGSGRMKSTRLALMGALCLIGVPLGADAQSLDVGDSREALLRLWQLTGDAPLNSFSLGPLVSREDEAVAGGRRPRSNFGRAFDQPTGGSCRNVRTRRTAIAEGAVRDTGSKLALSRTNPPTRIMSPVGCDDAL